MTKISQLIVKDTSIRTFREGEWDYICITDIAAQKNADEPKDVVKNWMRLKNTIEYLGLWEMLNNPEFKGFEFDPLFQAAGTNAFTLSPSNPAKKGNIRQEATAQKIRVVRKEGNRMVHREVAFYNLDAIISVGFRVNLNEMR